MKLKGLRKLLPSAGVIFLYLLVCKVYAYRVQMWNETGDLLWLRKLLFASIFSQQSLVWIAAFGLTVIFALTVKHSVLYSTLVTAGLLVLMLFLPSPLMQIYRVQNYRISIYDLMQSLKKDNENQETLYLDCSVSGVKYLGEKEENGLLFVSYTDGYGISTVFVSKSVTLADADTVKAYTIYKYSGILSHVHSD